MAIVEKYIVLIGDGIWAIPAAAIIAAALLWAGHVRRAAVWLLTLGLGGGIIAIGKLSFDFYGLCIQEIDYYSISGHAMLTASVYPVLLALFGASGKGRGKWGGFWIGLAAATVMAVVLVMEGYHTYSETIAGYIIGLLIAIKNVQMLPERIYFRENRAAILVLIPIAAGLLIITQGAVNPIKLEFWKKSRNYAGASHHYYRTIIVGHERWRQVILLGRE